MLFLDPDELTLWLDHAEFTSSPALQAIEVPMPERRTLHMGVLTEGLVVCLGCGEPMRWPGDVKAHLSPETRRVSVFAVCRRCRWVLDREPHGFPAYRDGEQALLRTRIAWCLEMDQLRRTGQDEVEPDRDRAMQTNTARRDHPKPSQELCDRASDAADAAFEVIMKLGQLERALDVVHRLHPAAGERLAETLAHEINRRPRHPNGCWAELERGVGR